MKREVKLFILMFFCVTLANAQVGINTESPQSMLHVVGSDASSPVRIDELPIMPTGSTANPQANVVVDEVTGELYKGVAASAPFYYITYTLENVNGDWVSDFNTLISADRYTLLIVGSSFDKMLSTYRSSSVLGNSPNISYDYYGPKNLSAQVKDGTWRIQADYSGSNPSNDNGTWIINCLILSNNQVNVLPAANINLGGSGTGSAGSPPII